jgi:hypothetical protein
MPISGFGSDMQTSTVAQSSRLASGVGGGELR